jgi:plastocyanin domain-containing protein
MKLLTTLTAVIIGFGAAFALVTNVVGAHIRTVKIKVDKNGFSPSSIEVEAGHKLNLVFNRTDKNNCGGTVIFPKLKIRKTLPVGKDVIVSFTPTAAGNVSFTCGMGVYKGSIVVAD